MANKLTTAFVSALMLCLTPFAANADTGDLEQKITEIPYAFVILELLQAEATNGLSETETTRLYERLERAFANGTDPVTGDQCFFGCGGGYSGTGQRYVGDGFREYAGHVLLADLALDLSLRNHAWKHLDRAESLLFEELANQKTTTSPGVSDMNWIESSGCDGRRQTPENLALELRNLALSGGFDSMATRLEPIVNTKAPKISILNSTLTERRIIEKKLEILGRNETPIATKKPAD